MSLAYYNSPIGLLAIVGNDYSISQIRFAEGFTVRPSESAPAEVSKCIRELDEYFNGQRQQFTVRTAPEGTEFQKKIWKIVQTVEYGRTASYADIARKYGDRKAIRAIGKANGQNPIVIVIPCHRILGLKGELTGYVGGLEKKKWLLKHENAIMPNGQLSLF